MTGTPFTYKGGLARAEGPTVGIPSTFKSSSSIPTSRYKYSEYLVANLVCSVSKSTSSAYAGCIRGILQPFTSRCRTKNERTIVNNTRAAAEKVSNVASEHSQGFRGRDRRCIRGSGILSIGISRASGIMFFGLFPELAVVLVGGFQGLRLAAGDASAPEALSTFFSPSLCGGCLLADSSAESGSGCDSSSSCAPTGEATVDEAALKPSSSSSSAAEPDGRLRIKASDDLRVEREINRETEERGLGQEKEEDVCRERAAIGR